MRTNLPLASNDSPTCDIASILDHGEWHGLQKRVLVLVSLVAMVDGVDAQVLSLSLPMIAKEWNEPRAAFATLMAISFVTMAIGTALGGLAGDRIGRRATLISATGLFGAFTLVGAFCHDVWSLGVARALASFGLGAAMPNVAALVAEYTPIPRRSLALGISMSALPVGGILLGLLGAYILPLYGWRSLFMIAGLLPLGVALLLGVLLPESVRYLVRSRAPAKRIWTTAVRMAPDIAPGSRFADSAENDMQKRAPLSAVLAGEFARDTLLLCLSFFCVVLSTYLVYTWAPSLFSDLGYSGGFIGTSLSCFSAGGLVGSIVGARFLQRVGSRQALVIMSLGGSLCAIALVPLIRLSASGSPDLLLAGLFCAGFLIPGTQSLIYVLAGQIYPTAVRATGVGISAGFGRCGAIASAFIGPFLLASRGSAYFVVLGGAMLIAAGALYVVRHRVGRAAAS